LEASQLRREILIPSKREAASTEAKCAGAYNKAEQQIPHAS
jgi:hypothetical protein